MNKLSRMATHLFTAVGMLLVLLLVLFFALQFLTKAPVVGGAAQWAGQHASGSAEGF